MQDDRVYEFRARVMHHHNDGVTMVDLLSEDGERLNFGDFYIPTKKIPSSLRSIGSSFRIRMHSLLDRKFKTPEEIRLACNNQFEIVAEET